MREIQFLAALCVANATPMPRGVVVDAPRQKGVMDSRLYDVLGVAADCSDEEIRKAYRKGAMKNHPDKNAGDADAAARFQAISESYTILSDADKRAFYDETGEVDDVEVRPEEFVEQFQEMMMEMMGGDQIMEMVAGMSRAELAAMPPFPFPKELFPPGTFPEGLRFSCSGLSDLPPSMQRAMDQALEAGDMSSLGGATLEGGGET